MEMSDEIEKQNVAAERRDARVDVLFADLCIRAHRVTEDITVNCRWVEEDLKAGNFKVTPTWLRSLAGEVVKLTAIVAKAETALKYQETGTL